jgi:hypothetical protein
LLEHPGLVAPLIGLHCEVLIEGWQLWQGMLALSAPAA